MPGELPYYTGAQSRQEKITWDTYSVGWSHLIGNLSYVSSFPVFDPTHRPRIYTDQQER